MNWLRRWRCHHDSEWEIHSAERLVGDDGDEYLGNHYVLVCRDCGKRANASFVKRPMPDPGTSKPSTLRSTTLTGATSSTST